MSETFGEYVRKRRIERNLTLRAMAKILGISPVYQSSIESGKRPAPKYELLQKMVEALDLNDVQKAKFYDLASQSATGKSAPQDIVDHINANQQIRDIIRASRDGNLPDMEITRLWNKIKNDSFF